MAKSRNPQRVEHGFVSRDRVRCPDCEDGTPLRSDLRNDGGAVVIGGGQLSGASKDVGVTRASVGCETCGGTGSILTTDIKRLLAAGFSSAEIRTIDRDPYSLPLTPEQAARMRRRMQ